MVGGENRRKSTRAALRKRRIDRCDFYSNLHQYSKNKIHCSCPQCSTKTKNKGASKLKGMLPSVNHSVSDRKKILRLNYRDE